MRYAINKTNYHDFKTISAGRLPYRSYFIPYPDKRSADMQDVMTRRYNSPKVICLSGEWDFKFYPRPAELPDVLDTEQTDFDRIKVPGCWQFQGYGKPFYVNSRYQFPYDPPKIPETARVGRVFTWFGADSGPGPRLRDPGEEYNYVGVYRTFFDVPAEKPSRGGLISSLTDRFFISGRLSAATNKTSPADDKSPDSVSDTRYVLSFLGVAGSADVYVNGRYTGYSEGSHNTAEFDVTENVHEGKNELVVVVHRWCTGTYLECQDMFRNNGIFRDVLLRISARDDIVDIDFSSSRLRSHEGAARAHGSGYALYNASVHAELYSDTRVRFTISGHGLNVSRTIESRNRKAHAVFDGIDIKEWTAETPFLYDLYIETPGSCVKIRIGFREVRTDGRIFLLNGRKIKLHGVNHHDTSPVSGYAMTPEEIERDVRLCKEYNIDTIRTSHYPPDPLLLDLCDELGVYVVDEADLETHGTVFHMLPASYNRISDDPKWAGHFVDRVKALYQRDKTHASIIMWSLGNESGGYFNTDLMYMYLKDLSPLPVHYESVIHSKRRAYDVGSEMYPEPSRLAEIGERRCKVKEFNDRPYFLCEYAHAMGVGPGGMEDYWKEIYRYDALMGGCVWEMADHAVLHADENAPYRYTYGGDHGEWEHDGNFCVDGLFYPDRKPSTGAKIASFVYRPLRISHIEGDRYEIFNTTGFTEGSSYYVNIIWSDGSEDDLIPDVSPLSRAGFVLETGSHLARCKELGTDCLVTFITRDVSTGREVSREQLLLEEAVLPLSDQNPDEDKEKQTDVEELSIKLHDGKPYITVNGLTLEPSDPYTVLFRAPCDNDFRLGGAVNKMAPFLTEKEKLVSAKVHRSGINKPEELTLKGDSDVKLTEGMKLEIRTSIRCKGFSFTCTDCYEQQGSALKVTSMLHHIHGRGYLPRFGKAYKVSRDFDHVEYYGRNGESYADMKEHTQIGRVTSSVSDMTEPNIRPQESGNRCDTRWASVSDGRVRVRFTALERPFELGIKPYSDRALAGMKHREDEISDGTYVTISAFQQGMGTEICGPGPSPDVMYPAKNDYRLVFIISCD